jgi:hypothetical protein
LLVSDERVSRALYPPVAVRPQASLVLAFDLLLRHEQAALMAIVTPREEYQGYQ